MRTFPSVALVLAACGGSESRTVPSAHDAPATAQAMGPDAVVVRIPRTGGVARAYVYPRLDSAVWTSGSRVAAPARALGFDADAGSLAIVDAKGLPVRLNLRQGDVTTATRTKLAALASADGDAIYGIAPLGVVTRLTPSGSWPWKAPTAPREIFPQPDGSLVVIGAAASGTTVLRLRPPDPRVLDSVVLPVTGRAVRTQVGDRIYFTVDSGLIGVRGRDLSRAPSVRFAHPVGALAPTPSGDRLYVAEESSRTVSVVDRYGDRVSTTIQLPAAVADLRMDALGRYVLARSVGSDSVFVIAIGTDRVIGALRSAWTADLPFVLPDGAVALATGNDVTLADGETLRPKRLIVGGAKDFWHLVLWNGFRPRAAGIDQPVTFASADSVDSSHAVPGKMDSVFAAAKPDSLPPLVRRDSALVAAAPIASAAVPTAGYVVQFASLLTEPKARDAAAAITVGATHPHVVATQRDGATIYRVVLGPYPTRAEAEKVGHEAGRDFWVYQGTP